MAGDRVTGVTLTGGAHLLADQVCNADPPTVYREMLVDGGPAARRAKRPCRSP